MTREELDAALDDLDDLDCLQELAEHAPPLAGLRASPLERPPGRAARVMNSVSVVLPREQS